MPRRAGARVLPVPLAAASAGTELVGGPVRLCGWSLSDGAASQALTARGSVAAPAAGATIASISLGNGLYQVAWNLELAGAAGAADIDNVGLYVGATLVAQSVNLGVAADYPQAIAAISVSGGPLTLTAKAIGAATAGTTYTVNLEIMPLTQSMAIIKDGGMAVALISIPQNGTATFWSDSIGILCGTNLRVLTTQGNVSGVLWYYLGSDYEPVTVKASP